MKTEERKRIRSEKQSESRRTGREEKLKRASMLLRSLNEPQMCHWTQMHLGGGAAERADCRSWLKGNPPHTHTQNNLNNPSTLMSARAYWIGTGPGCAPSLYCTAHCPQTKPCHSGTKEACWHCHGLAWHTEIAERRRGSVWGVGILQRLGWYKGKLRELAVYKKEMSRLNAWEHRCEEMMTRGAHVGLQGPISSAC